MIPDRAAQKALDWIADGMVVGLGTGRAASAFVEALGGRIRQGALRVYGIASSQATAELATRAGIPLTTLDQTGVIDVTVDGADEVAPNLDVIKGLGGALLREKVLAAMSRTWILCIDDTKLVERLGVRGILPVEVVPFATPVCLRRIESLGLAAELRLENGTPYLTDNTNHILHCHLSSLDDPIALAMQIRAIPGVVETGVFSGMNPIVLVQSSTDVRVLERQG